MQVTAADNAAALAPEPGQHRVLRQIAALVGHPRQQHCRDAARREYAARGGAHRVVQHRAALGQHSLLPVAGGHGTVEHTVKILLNFLHDLRVVFQGQTEHAGHRLLGHVVIGGAQSAGEHQQVAAGPGSLHRRPQTLGVVPHGGVVQHVDPGRGQQLRQKLRVGVGNIAQKQLGAHGDDLHLMGHGITSFSLGCRGVLLERKTPKRRPLAPPPGELSAQPTERGNANRWIIPFRSPYRPSQSPSVTALPEGEPSRGRQRRRPLQAIAWRYFTGADDSVRPYG